MLPPSLGNIPVLVFLLVAGLIIFKVVEFIIVHVSFGDRK